VTDAGRALPGATSKRRLVGLFLVAFALWPAVQHGLVRVYDVDPWRLFGWAMYTVPGPMKTLRVVEISRDGRFAALDFRRYDEADRAAVERFRIRRQSLGRLAGGDALARELLERHPDWEGVALPVLTLSLDRQSARTRHRVEQSHWWRDGGDEPFDVPERVFGAAPRASPPD
jgi:hypothetical protein